MKEELINLARLRLDKAEKTIRDAEILFGAASYYGTVNRSYYAAFYAARALLALKELDSSKHSGVISLFNGTLSKKARFRRNWAEF